MIPSMISLVDAMGSLGYDGGYYINEAEGIVWVDKTPANPPTLEQVIAEKNRLQAEAGA